MFIRYVNYIIWNIFETSVLSSIFQEYISLNVKWRWRFIESVVRQNQGVVTASQDSDLEQARQRYQIFKSHLQKIWRKWKHIAWSTAVRKVILFVQKSICLFASSYLCFTLRMSQKQRIKEGVFRWESMQAIEQNKKYAE